MQKVKGFTLVEILIVIAILIVLAAVSIPNILRSRINFYEASALASMRTISEAAQQFKMVNMRYPGDLSELGPPEAGGGPYQVFYCAAIAQVSYLDALLGCGTQPCKKDGYLFQLEGYTNTFAARGRPEYSGATTRLITGKKKFYVDESGIIRYTDQLRGWGAWSNISYENTIPIDY